jgi:hypothetical protein
MTAIPRGKDVLFLEAQDAERLGRRVRSWMVLHDVSLDEVATAMQCTRFHLSRALNGRVSFSLSLAWDLCRLTGLAIDGDDVHGPARARTAVELGK